MAVDALVEVIVNTDSPDPVKTFQIGSWNLRFETHLEWKIHVPTEKGIFCPDVRFSHVEHAREVAGIFEDAFVVPNKWAM